jgi:hypothetical protein
MNLAALVLTAVTAIAALWTVKLAYRAIRISRDASIEASDSAKSGKEAAEAAKATAEHAERMAAELRLSRVRDRLGSERGRLHDIYDLVVKMQTQQLSDTGGPVRWAEVRNLLQTKLAGLEKDFPATVALAQATSANTARVQDARVEVENAIREIERSLYVYDLEGNVLTRSSETMPEAPG